MVRYGGTERKKGKLEMLEYVWKYSVVHISIENCYNIVIEKILQLISGRKNLKALTNHSIFNTSTIIFEM